VGTRDELDAVGDLAERATESASLALLHKVIAFKMLAAEDRQRLTTPLQDAETVAAAHAKAARVTPTPEMLAAGERLASAHARVGFALAFAGRPSRRPVCRIRTPRARRGPSRRPVVRRRRARAPTRLGNDDEPHPLAGSRAVVGGRQ
jgi:hypothetical protein